MQVAHYVREMTDATTRLEEDDPERETEEETDLKEFMHQLDLFMQTLRRKIADKKKEIKMVRSTMVKDVDDVEYLRKLRALELSELEREATAALREARALLAQWTIATRVALWPHPMSSSRWHRMCTSTDMYH